MKKVNKAQLRLPIFIPMATLLGLVLIVGLISPKALYDGQNAIVSYAFDSFGWLFQLSSVIFFFLCLWAMFSKFGNIRLGGKDATPTMSLWNWFAISLCAGIATGILFWGIAEPITHFMSPPDGLGLEAGTEGAAMFSMSQTFIHWTFLPYAMYGIAGLGIAYATFNLKLPYTVSSILYPVFGKKVNGVVGDVVDNLCMLAMAGGVAAVLGVATMQISKGIEILTGLEQNKFIWVAVVGLIVVTYVISSYTGLNRGIRFLSDANTKLFIGMLLFIFILGPTNFILQIGTQGTGHFIQNFFTQTLYLSPVNGSEWPRWWPIYYWAIWLAYAPLTGMFLARISKGRTIRQFMMVNLFMPAIFGLLWFSVYGGAAINLEMNGAGLWSAIQQGGLEVSVFAFLKNFPLSGLTSALFLLAIYISVVTLADSMTTTVSSLSVRGAGNNALVEPPAQVKIFWGAIMSSIAIVNLIAGKAGEISGIDATKQIATVAGFPLLFLMLLIGYSAVAMLVKYGNMELNGLSVDQSIEEQTASQSVVMAEAE